MEDKIIDTQNKKILIIEDEQDLAKLLAARLKSAGYLGFIAGDAVQGVKMAHTEKPDLIILDLMLPAGNGLAVLQNLNLSVYLRDIPVVILTGIKDEGYKRTIMEKGVSGYFEKPYDAEKLLEYIKNLLTKKKEE